jgi:hypothetical protein
VKNVSRIALSEAEVKPKPEKSELNSQKLPASVARLADQARPGLIALRRLSPFHTYIGWRREHRKNTVVETDESGTKRSYDSSLTKALLQTTWRRLLLATCLEAGSSILLTTSSIITKRLVSFISNSYEWTNATEIDRAELSRPSTLGKGIGLAFGLAAMLEVSSLLSNHSTLHSQTCGRFWLVVG